MKKITYKDFPKDVREFIESYFPLEKVSSYELLHLSLDNLPKEYPEFIKAEFVPPYKISYYGKEKEIRWDGVIHDTAHFFQYHTNKKEFEKSRKESKVILKGKFSFYKENRLEKEAFRAQEQYLEFMRQKLGWRTVEFSEENRNLKNTIWVRQVPEYGRMVDEYWYIDSFNDNLTVNGLINENLEHLKVDVLSRIYRQGRFDLHTVSLPLYLNNFRFVQQWDPLEAKISSKQTLSWQFKGNIEDLFKKYEKTLKKKSNIDPQKTFRIYNMESGKLVKELTFEELNKKYGIYPSELERALRTNTAIKGLYVLDPEKEERKRLRIPNRLERGSESKGRRIIGINSETGTEYEFSSVREAERELGINRISITHALRGRQDSAGGWRWRYKDEKEERKEINKQEWVGREFILNGYIYLDIVDIKEEGEEIYIVMKDKNTGKLFNYTPQSLADNLQNNKLIESTSQKLSWKEIPEDLTGWLVKDSDNMYGVLINHSPYSGYYEARWANTEERAIRLYKEGIKGDYFQIPILRNRGPITPIKQIDSSVKTFSNQNFDFYKNQNKEMYKKRLEFYDKNKGPEIFWSSKDAQEKRFEALLDIGDLTGREILDVGCGYGDLLDYIENRGINIERYVGIDIVPEIVEKGKELHEGVNITVRDIQREPLEENSFDYVMGSGIFALDNNEWEKYVVDMLKEMLRVSKIGVGVNFLKQQPLNRLSWKEPREGIHRDVFKYIDIIDRHSDVWLSKSEVVDRLKVVFDDLDESTLENIYDEWRYDIESANRILNSQASLTSLKYNDPKQVLDLVKKYVTEKVILKDNYLNDDFTLFLYKT